MTLVDEDLFFFRIFSFAGIFKLPHTFTQVAGNNRYAGSPKEKNNNGDNKKSFASAQEGKLQQYHVKLFFWRIVAGGVLNIILNFFRSIFKFPDAFS